MSTLYKHQQKFLSLNPDKALCAFEAGTGKTKVAVEWLRSRQDNALVVVPKRIQEKWKKELGDVKATVVTKEQFKKLSFKNPSALVLDEAHYFSAPLFTKGRSQLAERTYNFIKDNPEMPVLLLTATPISSNPANLHTLLCYIGQYIPWPKWRNHFYTLQRLPFLPRPAWIPRTDWRTRIQPILLRHAHVALMSECVDYLPPVTEETILCPSKPFKDNPEWEPMASFVAEHRFHQKEKPKLIREIGEKYRKVIVIAHFRDQIEELYKQLSKDKQTYVLHGGTKDPEQVIKDAQEDIECYFIVQNSVAQGWDADTFSVMIFASMSYSVVHHIQTKSRIRRIHALKPVKYFYLICGKPDEAIFNQIKKGKDFIPSEWLV